MLETWQDGAPTYAHEQALKDTSLKGIFKNILKSDREGSQEAVMDAIRLATQSAPFMTLLQAICDASEEIRREAMIEREANSEAVWQRAWRLAEIMAERRTPTGEGMRDERMVQLGKRMAEARNRHGLPRAILARRIGADVLLILLLEHGELDVTEAVPLAHRILDVLRADTEARTSGADAEKAMHKTQSRSWERC